MKSEPVHKGGCGCGALRYQVAGDPIFVNNCHCRQCQHQTGSTSVVNAFYECDRVEILAGKLREYEVRGGSGDPHFICRCTQCGTAVLSYYSRLGKLAVGLRVGTLDDTSWVRPDAVTFVAEKMPWVVLPQDIPVFEKTYAFTEILPSERIARMEALLERRRRGDG